MAVLDGKLELCDHTQINAASGATSILGAVIDLGADNLDIGAGTPLELNILISVTPTTASTTLLYLYGDSDSAVEGGSIIMTFGSINSTMVAGSYVFQGRLPNEIDKQRYIALVATGSTTVDAAGYLDAWINLASDTRPGLQPSVLSC